MEKVIRDIQRLARQDEGVSLRMVLRAINRMDTASEVDEVMIVTQESQLSQYYFEPIMQTLQQRQQQLQQKEG